MRRTHHYEINASSEETVSTIPCQGCKCNHETKPTYLNPEEELVTMQFATFLVAIWSLVGALACGFLSWTARYRWRDPVRTRLFSYLGVIFTVIFMLTLWPYA
jgi:hypothetical protein